MPLTENTAGPVRRFDGIPCGSAYTRGGSDSDDEMPAVPTLTRVRRSEYGGETSGRFGGDSQVAGGRAWDRFKVTVASRAARGRFIRSSGECNDVRGPGIRVRFSNGRFGGRSGDGARAPI